MNRELQQGHPWESQRTPKRLLLLPLVASTVWFRTHTDGTVFVCFILLVKSQPIIISLSLVSVKLVKWSRSPPAELCISTFQKQNPVRVCQTEHGPEPQPCQYSSFVALDRFVTTFCSFIYLQHGTTLKGWSHVRGDQDR